MSPKRALIALAVVLMGTQGVLAQTQGLGSTSVYISDVTVSPAPIAGEHSTVTAKLYATGPDNVVVRFLWDDGSALTGNSPGSNQNTVAKTLPAAGEYFISLDFSPDGLHAGSRQVVVTVEASLQSDASGSRYQLPVFVTRASLSVLSENVTSSDVAPGWTKLIEFNVTNFGNAPDAPILLLPHVEGWDLRVWGNLSPIPPDATETGWITALCASNNSDKALNDSMTVVSSLADVSVRANLPLLRPNTNASIPPEPTVSAEQTSAQVALDQATAIIFDVSNTANDSIVVILNASLDPTSGWNASLSAGPGWPSRLESPSERGGRLVLPVPSHGSLPAKVTVTRSDAGQNHSRVVLHATVLSAANPDDARDATASVALAPPAPRLAFDPSLPITVLVGEPVGEHWVVRNRGMVASGAFDVEWQLRDNVETLASGNLSMPPLHPGEQAAVPIDVPSDGMHGKYALLATIVTPAVDELDAANASILTSVMIARGGVALRAPPDIIAFPGETIELRSDRGVMVENQGDLQDRFRVSASGSVSWVDSSYDLDVPPGSTSVIPISIHVPESPGVVAVNVTLAVESLTHPSIAAKATVVVSLAPVGPPNATFAPPSVGQVGTPSDFDAIVTDPIGVGEVTLVLTDEDAQRTSVTLVQDRASPDHYRATYTPSAPGNYSIEIRAVDSTPAQLLFVGDGGSWLVVGNGFGGIEPANFENGGRTGLQTLRFREAQDGTVAQVTFDLGAGPVPLHYPYAIRLLDQQGAVRIKLAAVSTFGASWNRSFDVFIDTTAPELSNATARLDKAGVVHVSVDVRDDDLVNVTARLTGSNGPGTFPLSRGAGSSYGADLPAPAGYSGLVILAVDSAGNQASAEVAAAHTVQALSLAALVIAVAGLALGVDRLAHR